jgi:hypothetical protein
MDYPHAMLSVVDGRIDLSKAYDRGMGVWDTHAITYGYKRVDESDEARFLASHVKAGSSAGLVFASDRDARAAGGVHPSAHLWDTVSALRDILNVREVALANFDGGAVAHSTPFAELERVLVPIYYLHRYQVEAAVKLIGGVRYV